MIVINGKTGSPYVEGDQFTYQNKKYNIIEKVFKVQSIEEKDKSIVLTLISDDGSVYTTNIWKTDYGKNPNIFIDGDTYKIAEIKSGDIAKFLGFEYDYNGSKQFNSVGGYKLLNNYTWEYKSEICVDKYLRVIEDLFDKISNESLKSMCSFVLKLYLSDFIKKPAANKHHHNYIGGLIQHTAEVMKIAYSVGSCVLVNMDYIIVGSFFHDIMKICEYSDEGVFQDYGKNIGHVVGSALCFENNAFKFNVDQKDIKEIIHVILSHHGKKEWGSPVEPQTAEAIIVHNADMISSYINPVYLSNTEINSKDYYLIG